jgi:hypothetical protein
MQEGGTMKKLIVLSEILAVTLLVGNFFVFVYAQDPANEEKPTFYRLIPGVYVNGWPRLTVSYPKEWVEKRPDYGIGGLFRAGIAVSTAFGREFGVYAFSFPPSLDKYGDALVRYWRAKATDVTVVIDKPSQLRDGTLARENELQMVINGEPFNLFGVARKKGDLCIIVNVGSFKEKIGEDQRAIPYSIEFEPGKDEPVKVPHDVQEFLDSWRNATLSHDLAKVMANYSDRYLNSGIRKGEMERFWRQYIGSLISMKGTITDFVPVGYRAYLTGFGIINGAISPLTESSIIKENGEWKWFGNQRDVAP